MRADPLPTNRPYRLARWLALCLILAGTGCSQQRDAFLNRAFHRLTARDNGWFNANEKLKETVRGIEDAHLEDFDQVLPLFVYGTEAQAAAAKPDLEKCIDKCSLVIERHSMEIGGQERNKWIDDAWFVIAKSHFYMRNYHEAERGFAHITRRFKGSNREHESHVWLARTAIELGQFAKARSALDKVRETKKLPKRFDHGELSAVQAHLDLRRGKVDDAIMHLEHAVPLAARKRERVRWAFILAQLYERQGQEDKAIKQYAAVTRMNPPYEIAFHAQIFQALAFSKGNSKLLRQKLNRMLRDEKHVDHFDMVHYALADLDLKERDKRAAIENLETSARVSTTDTRQKAKSFMKLADLYFDDRVYASAQKYYDSTRTLLDEEHARYREVDMRADVLGELVEQLDIIAVEDSLQELAGLDEQELERRVRSFIRSREAEEQDKQRQEEEARARLESAPDTGKKPPTVPGTGTRGAWYFYDPQQIARGMTNFRKQWGPRKLEDDWRRKDRSGSAFSGDIDEGDVEALSDKRRGKDTGEEEWRDPAFYTKDLPRDEAALEASNARICNALYVSGMIYKEQLKDVDNAIESFEVLNGRFDDCLFTPESHYQLYRIYLEKEATGWIDLMGGSGSQTYADIILERWPGSEFARLVRDPNILQADQERRRVEEEAYKETYQAFRRNMYGQTIAVCDHVIAEEPHNHFLAKYHLLRALAIGSLRDAAGYRRALGELRDGFPGTDEAKAAEELLAQLDKGASDAGPAKPGPGLAYKPGQGRHQFALIVPNAGNDMTAIKAKLSDFNATFFRQPGIQITNNFLDQDNQVVLVSYFDSKAKAMEFYKLFKGNKDLLAGINDAGHAAFVISPDNYSQLHKSKDVEGYAAFFSTNYLGGQ